MRLAGFVLEGSLAIAVAAGLYLTGVHVERWRWQVVQAQEAVDRAAQEQANRAEENRRFTKIQEIADDATKELALARADADAADAAGDRLRAKVRDLSLSLAALNPGSPGNSEAGTATVDLLVGVQQRLDEAAGGIARYADEASAAGRACERSYDALKGKNDGWPESDFHSGR